MPELSAYQRYLLRELGKPSTTLEAAHVTFDIGKGKQTQGLAAFNGTAVEMSDIRVLVAAGFIEGKQEGAWVRYGLTEKGQNQVVEWRAEE